MPIYIFLLLSLTPLEADDNYYPAKNKVDEWFHRSNPFLSITFREPLYYTLFEFQSSMALYGFPGLNVFEYREDAMGFDSTEVYLNNFRNNFIRRNYFDIDLNLIRVNWLAMMYPQNILDYLNGIGVRRLTHLYPVGLNEEWENETTGLAVYNYSPQIDEVYLSQALYYQPLESIFFRFEHSYAMGRGTAYQTLGSDRLLDLSGSSQRFALSLQLVLDNKSRNTNLTAALQAFYHIGYYRIRDRNDISPIEYIDMRSLGIGVSLHAQLGARKSGGDKALKLIRERSYIAARQEMNSYVLKHPESPRRDLALRYIAYCDSMMHFEYYKMGNLALADFKLAEALQYYERAFAGYNEKLRRKVTLRRITIGRIFVLNALLALQNGDYEQAGAILNQAEELSSFFGEELEAARAYVNIHRATALIRAGLFSRADSYLQLAEQQNPELREAIRDHRRELASAYVGEARSAVERQDLELALGNIELAGRIDRKLARDLNDLGASLKQKISETRTGSQQPDLYKLYSDLKAEQFKPDEIVEKILKAELGMTLVNVLDSFGQPASRKTVSSNGQEFEMLVYRFSDKTLELYFKNYYLHRIDELPPE